VAGKKQTSQTTQPERKHLYQGGLCCPVLVAVKKLFSDGYTKYISAKNTDTQEIIKDHTGRPVPWKTVDWD